MTEVNEFNDALRETHIPRMDNSYTHCREHFERQVVVNALVNHGMLRPKAELLAKRFDGTPRHRYEAIKRKGYLDKK